MSIYAYEQRYSRLKFFKNRSIQFISWICRLMQPQWYDEGEFYFFEDDDVEEMFFLIKGQAEFVLPQYSDQAYLHIAHNNHFGLVDVIGSSLKHNFNMKEWW